MALPRTRVFLIVTSFALIVMQPLTSRPEITAPGVLTVKDPLGFNITVRYLGEYTSDQLLAFAWKFMFPLALANLGVTVMVLWLMERT